MSGAVTIVTGAGSGIGRATALLFARRGARVLAADVNGDTVRETAAMAEGTMLAAELDICREPAVIALLDRCERELGPPAVLANLAGAGSATTAPGTPLEMWEHVFARSAGGTYLCCKHAIPRMIAAGGGSIVNLGSGAGLVGRRNRAAYVASKEAVIDLTRALALDHGAAGVRVNCICPGSVDSPWTRGLRTDAGESREALVAPRAAARLGTAEEVAAAVRFVASEAAAFMTGAALVLGRRADRGLETVS